MRCSHCNYPLWNIRNQCPECGTPFAPSAFDFAPNRVEFCCPHCEQPYYGTSERGHLVPAEFACVSCHRPIRMDEMMVRPAPGVSESAARPVRMPWTERGDRSRFGALCATIGMALVQPGRLMQAVPPASPLGPAWKFAIVTNALMMVARLVPAMCFMVVLPFLASAGGGPGGGGGPGPGMMLGIFGGAIGAGFVVGMLIIVVSLALWPLVCHWVLLITGGAAAGLRRTTQAILYSSGANASSAIPCLGDFGGIWWIVSAVLMVRTGQNVHGGRATLAVLTFPMVLFVLVLGGYALFVMALLSGASGGGGIVGAVSTRSIQTAQTTRMIAELKGYAADHGSRGPPHAAALVCDSALSTGNLIAMGTNTSHQEVSVGGVTLSQFQRQGIAAQKATAARAAADLPADVTAHRLGDYVFTYHGVDLSAGDPALWIVVHSPDPDLNPPPPGGHDVFCASRDGSVERIPGPTMKDALAQQNAIRTDAGLAPLPDPSTVTHDQPAAAGGGGS